jgi:hypothetical protein
MQLDKMPNTSPIFTCLKTKVYQIKVLWNLNFGGKVPKTKLSAYVNIITLMTPLWMMIQLTTDVVSAQNH